MTIHLSLSGKTSLLHLERLITWQSGVGSQVREACCHIHLRMLRFSMLSALGLIRGAHESLHTDLALNVHGLLLESSWLPLPAPFSFSAFRSLAILAFCPLPPPMIVTSYDRNPLVALCCRLLKSPTLVQRLSTRSGKLVTGSPNNLSCDGIKLVKMDTCVYRLCTLHSSFACSSENLAPMYNKTSKQSSEEPKQKPLNSQ